MPATLPLSRRRAERVPRRDPAVWHAGRGPCVDRGAIQGAGRTVSGIEGNVGRQAQSDIRSRSAAVNIFESYQ